MAANEVSVNGWTAGPGLATEVVSATGLQSQAVKVADVDLLGDGAHFGVDYRDVRRIVFEFAIMGDTDGAVAAELAAFRSAWDVGDDTTLTVTRRGVTDSYEGRCRRYDVDEELSYAGVLTVVAEFVANAEGVGGGS